MIWILIGIAPMLIAAIWMAFKDLGTVLVVLGFLAVATAMSVSITYGIWQLSGGPQACPEGFLSNCDI